MYGVMSFVARQDVMVATAVATAIAAGALLVGAVFDPARPAFVDGRTGDGNGGELLVPGAPAERFRAVSQDVDRDSLQASIALPPAIGRDRDADAGTGGVDGEQAGGGSEREVLRDDGSSASGAASVSTPPATGGTTTPAVENGPSGSAIAPPAAPDPAPAGASSRVRLRVIKATVTGTNGGQLQPGSQVRLRLATSNDAPDAAADPAPAAKAANVDAAAAPLPEQLDVRLGLDAAAVAALRADTRETNGALALRASVDLVDKTSDAPAGRAPFALRVRMRLLPAETGSTLKTSDGEQSDGASNVVEVTAPIADDPAKPGTPGTPGTPSNPGTPSTPGNPSNPETPTSPGKPETPGAPTEPSAPTTPETPGGTDGGQPGTGEGGATTDPVGPAERQPVEVVLSLPASGTGTIGDGGASVDVPLPESPTTKPDSSAGVDVVVHLPEAEEPLDENAPPEPETPEGPATPEDTPVTPGTAPPTTAGDPETSTTTPVTAP